MTKVKQMNRKGVIMYKIFAVLATVFVILSVISYLLFHVKSNPKFNKEINDAVKDLVQQLLTVQYKTHSTEMLEKLLTEEMLEKLDSYHPNFFRDKSFHFLDSNYMKSLHYFEKSHKWEVSIRIHEGLWDDGFYLVVGITKKEDGTYAISFIGRDV